MSSLYNMVNVPTGVWIDEQGRIVRPGEVAYSSDKSFTVRDRKLTVEGDVYVAALRDWVGKGAQSPYALKGEDLARRLRGRTAAEAEADAGFKLAVYFHQNGHAELAARYWAQAQGLNPESWNYQRQEWSFTPGEAGRKWLAKFLSLEGKPYYAPLDLSAPPKPREKEK